MGKMPQIIQTDDEGALQTEAMQKCFKETNTDHIVTGPHVHVAEPCIRSAKSTLCKRTMD